MLFNDASGAGGAFGHWRSGVTGTWHDASRKHISPASRARVETAIAESRRQRQAERQKVNAEAQERAIRIWAQSAEPMASHPYLVRKGVEPHDIRQRDDRLIIPMRDGEGVLWNVQTITPEGTKRFLTGGRKYGCFHVIGAPIGAKVLICEGYSTGASLHESAFLPVVVAFDCGNLEPVARAIREKYPDAEITICADNDAHVSGNPGLTKAKQAAQAVNGKLAIPPEPHNDFNDAALADMEVTP